LVVVRCGEVGVMLTTEKGRWWCSVPVEKDGERGKSSVEGWRRCGVLWGRVLHFIGPREGLQGSGSGNGSGGAVMADDVNGL
jgi:hypothetical protein